MLALLEATQLSNPIRLDYSSRLSITHFSGVDAIFNIKDKYIFNYSIFVLDNTSQASSSILKWNSCVQIGIYIGKSSFYTQFVSLIMNAYTRYISL